MNWVCLVKKSASAVAVAALAILVLGMKVPAVAAPNTGNGPKQVCKKLCIPIMTCDKSNKCSTKLKCDTYCRPA